MKNDNDVNLVKLINSMMKYGNSAYTYISATHIDINGDGRCDNCGACNEHTNENCDNICDVCGAEGIAPGPHTNNNCDNICDNCGEDGIKAGPHNLGSDNICDCCGEIITIGKLVLPDETLFLPAIDLS